MGGPMQGQLGSVPPRTTEIERKGPFFMEVTSKSSVHSYTATCREVMSSTRQRHVRHTDHRFGRRPKIPLSEDSNYSPQGSNVSEHHITAHQMYGTLSESISHCHLTGKLHPERTILSEQRLSLNGPSYRNSPKIAPVSGPFPGNCIGQESRCNIYSTVEQSIFLDSVSSWRHREDAIGPLGSTLSFKRPC